MIAATATNTRITDRPTPRPVYKDLVPLSSKIYNYKPGKLDNKNN